MHTQKNKSQESQQEAQDAAQEIAQILENYLSPLLTVLDTLLDKRLVRTLVYCCVAILRFRNNKQGLLLSELGSYIDADPGLSTTATAGTKSIGNLIRSLKWSIFQIDRYLLEEADREVKKLKGQGKRLLCIWDGSVIEKPESSKLEGLGPVVSSKAKRLHRSKKGLVFHFPPKKPITVAGMQWTAALITGMEGMVKVAFMRWWTTKGDYATTMRMQEEMLLRKCVRQWGDILLHVFDRGYASGPWIKVLQAVKAKFVIRWKRGTSFSMQKEKHKNCGKLDEGRSILRIKRFVILIPAKRCPALFGGHPFGMVPTRISYML